MKFSKKLTAAAAIVAAGFATNVAAETAESTINVYAGLAPVLELTCTDVHFGVWRVPTGDRTESNEITLTGTTTLDTVNGTATFSSSVSADGSTIAESNNYDAVAGQCTATGSTAADNTDGTARFSVSGDVEVAVTGSLAPITNPSEYEFGTIAAPDTTNGTLSGLVYTLSFDVIQPKVFKGNAYFAIGGTLTIPNNIVADNYGGYKSSAGHVVVFNDQQ